MLNVKQGSCEKQFFKSLVWPDWESNPGPPFQQQTLYPLDYRSVIIARDRAQVAITGILTS